MKRWKKITLWSIAGVLLFCIWLVYSNFSAAGVFRRCVLSPIPHSIRDLKSAETGLAQDWSVSFYFHASPEDVAKILSAVGFTGPVNSPEEKARFVKEWRDVYTGMGSPLPELRTSASFYFRRHQTGFDYALVSPDTHEVFLTRWEGY
jgi:hypothetical protein